MKYPVKEVIQTQSCSRLIQPQRFRSLLIYHLQIDYRIVDQDHWLGSLIQ